MTCSDEFKDLYDLTRDVKSVITDSEDRDKVYAIIDRLVPDRNDVNYWDNEYRYGYSDNEVYAIIKECGFDEDQLYLECGVPGKYRIDVLAKLGRLVQRQLHTIKWYIGILELEE